MKSSQPRYPMNQPPQHARPVVKAVTEEELMELQMLLDTVPQPLDPLDTSMLDGFLCGVLLQPKRIAADAWLPFVTDSEGRPLPSGFDASRLHVLASQRHRELDDAIARRQWFDPWVFELEEDAPPSEAVYGWVAGFSTALEAFPALMRMPEQQLVEPLAILYAHLDPDDLEDADELLAEIETLEPPVDLEEAVEGLVRSTLLLADVSRPAASRPVPRSFKPSQRGRQRR